MIRIEIDGRGVLVAGPLEGVAVRLEDERVRRGFRRKALANQLRLLAHLSRWLQARDIDAGSLESAHVDAFLVERRHTHTGLFSRKALGPMLVWLADEGVISQEAAAVPVAGDPPELVGFDPERIVVPVTCQSAVVCSELLAQRVAEHDFQDAERLVERARDGKVPLVESNRLSKVVVHRPQVGGESLGGERGGHVGHIGAALGHCSRLLW